VACPYFLHWIGNAPLTTCTKNPVPNRFPWSQRHVLSAGYPVRFVMLLFLRGKSGSDTPGRHPLIFRFSRWILDCCPAVSPISQWGTSNLVTQAIDGTVAGALRFDCPLFSCLNTYEDSTRSTIKLQVTNPLQSPAYQNCNGRAGWGSKEIYPAPSPKRKRAVRARCTRAAHFQHSPNPNRT
jgi:hypothetical protein